MSGEETTQDEQTLGNDDQDSEEEGAASSEAIAEDGALDDPEAVDDLPEPNDERQLGVQQPEGVIADFTPENTTEEAQGKRNL